MENVNLEEQLRHVPDMPGVYVYKGEDGAIIYVGKAKSLRKRVFSYFASDTKLNAKTRVLVRQIRSVDVIVVGGEEEALLLENSLIKANQPRYNILLKDDKTYPWVCVTNEEFPRVVITRRYDKRVGKFFGPFTHVDSLKRVLEEIRHIVGYRTCKLALSSERVARGDFSSCLEFHIQRCQAPCIGRMGSEEYKVGIKIISELLNGKINEASSIIQNEIDKHIELLEFEQADRLQQTLTLLKKYREKHSIVNPHLGELDVITLYLEGDRGVAVYMQVREGQVVLSVNREVKNPLLEEDEQVWMQASYLLTSEFETTAKLLLTNVVSQHKPSPYTRVETPQVGDKYKLIKMCLLNAKRHLLTISTRIEKDPDTLLRQVQKDLGLMRLPRRIECIDNSNTLGTYPVSSCVVFIDGKARKKEYRTYNIQEVKGPNDYDTMKEVIERRYGKGDIEHQPDLLIIDGGRGQLNAVMDALKRIHRGEMCHVIALAEKMEEVYKPNETYPLFLPKTSPTLRLLQEIRDEAHRYGVKAHAARRDGAVRRSELENIPGIGQKTIAKLYSQFPSLEDVKKTDPQKIAEVIGQKKTRILIEWVKEKETRRDEKHS